MKTFKLIFITLLFATFNLNAQQLIKLSFETDSLTISREKNSMSYPIVILMDSNKITSDELKLYTLTASVNRKKTTLPNSAYTLKFNSITLDKMSSKYTFFITVKGDSISDRDRIVHLDLELRKNGELNSNFSTENISHKVLIGGVKVLKAYDYLGYIGTNFDLIDGTKSNDIFFAINISSPPREDKSKFGFNLSLYGNRTLSSIDTSGIVSYISGYEPVGGDSVAFYRSELQRTIISVSDNIGAMFSPLFRLGSLSDSKRQTQIYYAPQFEFIWRRTLTTISNINSMVVDTTYRSNRPLVRSRTFPEVEKIPMNIYDIYLGLAGLSLIHENESISVRVQGSFGLNYSYKPEGRVPNSSGIVSSTDISYIKERNWFTYLRTFITEPKSGITFGAEVSNFIFITGRYNPYYNVTLSKAITLDTLGSFFQPITSR